jgi:hypothetical protein
VSDSDAYRDEMRPLRRLSDSDLDRVLAGDDSAMDAEAEELAAFAVAARAGLLRMPSEATEARHLAAIVAAAREGGRGERPAESKRRPSLGLPSLRGAALRVALAAASLMLVTAGLAVAGVRLPEPATSVLEDLGVQLPNQAGELDPPSENRRVPGREPESAPVVPGPGGAPARPPVGDSGQGRPEPARTPGATPQVRGRPESVPPGGSPPVERGRPESVAPRGGPPTGTPDGPPAGAPDGPPIGTPDGPPAGAPDGPPDDAPAGPPEGAAPPPNVPSGGVGAREGHAGAGAGSVAPREQTPPEEGTG